MCIQDYQLGREQHKGGQTLAVAASITPIVAANPRRTALLMGTNGVDAIYISQSKDLTGTNGMLLGSGNGPLVLDVQSHGALVTDAWYAIGTAGTGVMFVGESYLDRET